MVELDARGEYTPNLTLDCIRGPIVEVEEGDSIFGIGRAYYEGDMTGYLEGPRVDIVTGRLNIAEGVVEELDDVILPGDSVHTVLGCVATEHYFDDAGNSRLIFQSPLDGSSFYYQWVTDENGELVAR